MVKDIHIDTFTRITQVSRETITSLKKYENILIKANKTLNLIQRLHCLKILISWGFYQLDMF